MKYRAEEALRKKLAAAGHSHGDAKAPDKTGAKPAKRPKSRIIRHQGR